MVDLHSQHLDIKDQIDSAIQEVIQNTSFINGPSVKEFGQELSVWNNTKHVIPCANGTDGLQIAIMALSLERGDEIVVPAFTYIATVEVIALLGLKPIFVDVDYNTFNIDIEKLRESISDKTKLIIPVHLYGQCANMEDVNILAKEFGLFVIEDLAQALGARFDGTKTGNLGDIGVTSFFPSKNLGCYGDGGAIMTNNDELAEQIRMIANHGQKSKYYHEIVGVNSRLDSIQAAVLSEKLKKLDEYESSRNHAADFYDKELSDVPFLEIPYRYERSSHVFHQYTLKVKEGRDELGVYLKEKGIPTMVYYPLPIPEQNAYKHFESSDYEVSRALSREVISLPIHTHITADQMSYICTAIKNFQL